MTRNLAVGELLLLNSPYQIELGELLPHLEVLFVENRDTEQHSEPIEATDWEAAAGIVKACYPSAFIEPWTVFDDGTFDCASCEREGEVEISTQFYESERALVSDALSSNRLEDCGIGGWIVWYCRIFDTTKERLKRGNAHQG